MASSHKDKITYFAQLALTVTGTAETIGAASAATLRRKFIFTAPGTNTSPITVSDTKANAEADNGFQISPGTNVILSGSGQSGSESLLEIGGMFYHSDTTGDKLNIGYFEEQDND